MNTSKVFGLPRLSIRVMLAVSFFYAASHPAFANDYRLSREVVPEHYSILIQPDLDGKTFSGDETISVSTERHPKTITLNSVDLNLSQVAVDGDKSAVSEIVTDRHLERTTFTLKQPLTPGKHDLSLHFSAPLTDQLVGFYRSSFKGADGKDVTIASTDFEPTDARRMMPCFDEPDLKAVFELSVKTDKALATISNTEVESTTDNPDGKTKTVKFAATPKMSTYLLALIVGPFEATEPADAGGVPVRVWAPAGSAKLGEYARDVAARVLPFYASYFGTPYPNKKLDLIAIPNFASGAMENLGAVTFRQTALLTEGDTTSVHAKQRIAEVVAHELAHMWFGDLVTMSWWDDLWLNEAFASWMSYKAMDGLYPEWHVWQDFNDWREDAMQTDALKSSRAIHADVTDPNSASEMFDSITYAKGASIIKMLEAYLGDDTFQSGVQAYIRKHSFANAKTEDFWQALSVVSDIPVGAIMHDWVYQAGYPLISLEELHKSSKLFIKQKRFFLDPDATEEDFVSWTVPMSLRDIDLAGSNESSGKAHVLIDAAGTLTFKKNSGLPLLNSDADGYYRVSYPEDMLKKLGKDAENLLTPSERFALLSDCWELAYSSQIPASHSLDLLQSYKKESEPSVVGLMLGQLGAIDNYVGDDARLKFQEFVKRVAGPLRDKLGWHPTKDETDLTRKSRAAVLLALGTIGQDADTIAKARDLFNVRLVKDENAVDVDLRGTICQIVAYNGGTKEYEQMLTLWKSAKNPQSEIRYLSCLSAFRNDDLAKRTLGMLLTPEVRSQDFTQLLGGLLRNRATRQIAWQFMKDNYPQLEARLPEVHRQKLLSGIGALSTEEQFKEATEFFKKNPRPYGKKMLSQELERVSVNVKFRQSSSKSLDEYFKDSNNESVSTD